MSNQSSGISMSDVYSAIRSEINPLRNEVHQLQNNFDNLKGWVEKQIQRLEQEMIEVGKMIVKSIDAQTIAIVGGVSATTAMVEATRRQIEDDFQSTRQRIELQTESALQVELGKKVAESSSLRSKLDAFGNDIKTRFEKSIESAAINRELYNLNFAKILDEYQNKIHTIGEHIFQIRMEDIAPAEKAARIPYEAAHSLPIEMDLKRLELRSQNLDETLAMLKASRLDEVQNSIGDLEGMLAAYALGVPDGAAPKDVCVEALVTHSKLQSRLVVGQHVLPKGDGATVNFKAPDPGLSPYLAPGLQQKVMRVVSERPGRAANGAEVVELSRAAQSLLDRGLIANEALELLEDFLGAEKLRVVEA